MSIVTMMRLTSAFLWGTATTTLYRSRSSCCGALAFSTMTTTTTLSSSSAASSSITIPPENTEAIAGLEPAQLWKHFATLSSIPRPSGQEDAILDYIKAFAQERNLKWKQDAVGNLVVFYPGTGRGRLAPSVVIQGHVDMVTEKNRDTVHDFTKDPILLQRLTTTTTTDKNNVNGETWLGARGTTLGADNGIGVAAALALMETPIVEVDDDDETGRALPPLEALFTVDEETGLTGATQLDASALGLCGKTMLNLDTEEWGELYVGCAGGGESTIEIPVARRQACDSTSTTSRVELRVEGLLGGHSGINIHEGRANAILLCAAAVNTILQHQQKGDNDAVQLVSLTGGDKHNAIPREARAVLTISSPEAREAVEKTIAKCMTDAQAEYGVLETNLKMHTVALDDDKESENMAALDEASTRRLLSVLLALPHGPLKFSHVMPDLVETSNNVASISMDGSSTSATILCSTRSSIDTALEKTRSRLQAIAELAGARITLSEAYPGWNPNMDSPLLQKAKTLLSKKVHKTPGVKAIHAGLECGLLMEKMGGGMDALSFGPTITGAHSPDERIHVDTVAPFFELVKEILGELAEESV